jgi:(p)ppGpp synthase/HD superfamily hydrolase
LDTIERLFGEPVANIVRECSDSKSADREHKLPWQERKQAYVAHLHVASTAALLVSAADKVHNARDILASHWQIGDGVWGRFKAGKADQLRHYRELVRAFQSRADSPKALVDELDRLVTTLEAG